MQGREKKKLFLPPKSQVFEQSQPTEILWNKTVILGQLTDTCK